MKTASSPSSGSRFAFLDNLRIYLTILVILHHTALAFGGSGSWTVDDPNADLLSEVVFTFFNAVNQTYFMSLFFLMAGYFTPRSLEKKGPRSYLLDRLIRLGIPLLVYTTLIINLNIYIVQVLWLGQPMTWVWEYNPGHLWFLQALFIFAVIYVIYRLIFYKDPTASRWHVYLDRFPPDRVLLVCIAVLSVLTFLVRLAAPIGEWFFGLQLAHFSHYVFCFFVGILFYRGEWFSKLQRPQAKRWGIVALVTIPFFFVLLVAGRCIGRGRAAGEVHGWAVLAVICPVHLGDDPAVCHLHLPALFLPRAGQHAHAVVSPDGWQRIHRLHHPPDRRDLGGHLVHPARPAHVRQIRLRVADIHPAVLLPGLPAPKDSGSETGGGLIYEPAH